MKFKVSVLLCLVIILSSCKAESEFMNWGFELGTLDGYNADDDSLISSADEYLENRPYIKEGQYFLSSKDVDKTVVTTKTFTIEDTGYISFLMSGVGDEFVYVSLVDAKTNEELDRIYNTYYDGGFFTDHFTRMLWDCSSYLGEKVYLKFVDDSSTGYFNIDDIDVSIDQTEELRYLDDQIMRTGVKTDDLLTSAGYYIDLNKYKVLDQYRYDYHVMGEIGWINDPNGFVEYNNDYHLFYQHHPYSTMWGPMYWGHVKSDDLVKWEYLDIALAPHVDDAGGGAAFSGSAIEIDDTLYLMYTENWVGYQHQVIKSSTDGEVFFSFQNGEAVIDESDLPWYANPLDFRDPKIWKENDLYYAVVGSRQINGYGQVLLFESTDLANWDYVGPVIQGSVETLYTLGYMFECPDLFTLDGKDVLIMSPQEIPGHRNNHGTVYIVGNLNKETGILEDYNINDIKEIDYGFDFYAPQTMIDSSGRRIMVAWMQSWNRSPLTSRFGFAGAMTIPRELSLDENGNLIQYPISELESYRANETTETKVVTDKTILSHRGNVLDIELTFDIDQAKTGMTVLADSLGNGTEIYYEDGYLYLDRTNSVNQRFDAANYLITRVEIGEENDQITLRILLDKHSVEVFVNDGEYAMTSTVYYDEERTNLFVYGNQTSFDVTVWDLVIE